MDLSSAPKKKPPRAKRKRAVNAESPKQPADSAISASDLSQRG
jgi:hypothetical protein